MSTPVWKWLSRVFGFRLQGNEQRDNPKRCPGRSGHTSVCIGENLLVWGGYRDDEHSPYQDERYLSPMEIWVYNADMDCWTSRKCTVPEGDSLTPVGTSGACSVLILPYWYIVGGHTGFGNINHVWRLNVQTFEWEFVRTSEPGLSPRDKFTAWAYEQRIYCFGGFGIHPRGSGLHNHGVFIEDETEMAGFNRGWNNQLLILDTVSFEWLNPKCHGPLPSARAAHSAVLLGDKVYIFGGRHGVHRLNDLHCLDLKSLTWSGELNAAGPLPEGRSWHTMSDIGDNRLLLFGGFSQDQRPLDDVWLLDMAHLQWTLLSPGNGHPRLWHTASVTSSGTVLVFGGCKNNILSPQHRSRFSGSVIKFEVQPKRLDRLCMHAVFRHRKKTRAEWELLPVEMQKWLAEKKQVEKELRNLRGKISYSGFTNVSLSGSQRPDEGS
ncbi:hypothetical protein BaRGS_00018588 [Batillaria attramentaria]|uniref:Uncharacterized protein n=1 Tax=Batillaria attramentaria TaxID=370345 RepID=A0ABD0KTD8_9CAEN